MQRRVFAVMRVAACFAASAIAVADVAGESASRRSQLVGRRPYASTSMQQRAPGPDSCCVRAHKQDRAHPGDVSADRPNKLLPAQFNICEVGQGSLPEWFKGVDSSSTSESCVGSNPTAVIFAFPRSSDGH